MMDLVHGMDQTLKISYFRERFWSIRNPEPQTHSTVWLQHLQVLLTQGGPIALPPGAATR